MREKAPAHFAAAKNERPVQTGAHSRTDRKGPAMLNQLVEEGSMKKKSISS